MCILDDLVRGLRDRNTRALQFEVDHRHAVYQEHEIASALRQELVRGSSKLWLACDLVVGLTTCDFAAVVDLERDLFTQVVRLRCIAGDSHAAPVDELIEPQRRAQLGDLLDDLVHLGGCQRDVTKSVLVTIVVIEDGGPVIDELAFSGAVEYLIPAMTAQHSDNVILEARLVCVRQWCSHDERSLDEHALQQRRLGLCQLGDVAALSCDKRIEVREDLTDSTLFFEGGE